MTTGRRSTRCAAASATTWSVSVKLGAWPATGCAPAHENTVRTDSTPDFAIRANWPS